MSPTLPKFTGETLIFFSGFLENISFYAFRLSKCIKLYIFSEKEIIKKICVPTLPKNLVTLPETHLFFLIWPDARNAYYMSFKRTTDPLIKEHE